MIASARHQAARNASQELRDLVGIRWALGKIDLQRAQEDGLDCLGLMVAAYTIIGRHLEEPDRWRFPIPVGYPYEEELPDGGWLPEDDIAEWRRHFLPVLDPVFGASVTMNADHIGVLIEPARAGTGFDVLHSHRSSGVVLHPLDRISQWASGFYVLAATGGVATTIPEILPHPCTVREITRKYADSDADVSPATTTGQAGASPKMADKTALHQ